MDYGYRRTHVSKRFGRTHGSAPTGEMDKRQCSASIPTPELVLDHGFRWDDDKARGGGSANNVFKLLAPPLELRQLAQVFPDQVVAPGKALDVVA